VFGPAGEAEAGPVGALGGAALVDAVLVEVVVVAVAASDGSSLATVGGGLGCRGLWTLCRDWERELCLFRGGAASALATGSGSGFGTGEGGF
jgi:hypothetical protein